MKDSTQLAGENVRGQVSARERKMIDMSNDDREPLSLREMAARMKPGDRWPYEPPAPNSGPGGGVRAPSGPDPLPSLADEAEIPDFSG